MQLKTVLFVAAAFGGLATALPSSIDTRQTASTNISIPRLEEYLQFSLEFAPPAFGHDFFGRVGLSNQANEGSFSGMIEGTIPAVGNIQLDYAEVTPSSRTMTHSTILLNTTAGEELILRSFGPLTTSGETNGAAGRLLATLQTSEESLMDVNSKSFVLDFSGRNVGDVLSGGGKLYEIV